MGQFTERYEKLQTWAVLPAEPFAAQNDAERLDATPLASPIDLDDGSPPVSVTLTPMAPASTDDDALP